MGFVNNLNFAFGGMTWFAHRQWAVGHLRSSKRCQPTAQAGCHFRSVGTYQLQARTLDHTGALSNWTWAGER